MKLRALFLALAILQAIAIKSQTFNEMQKINVDSLQDILPGLEGTEKINALNKVALALCAHYPDSTIAFAELTILESDSLNYRKGLADGYFDLGNAYFFKNDFKNSVINNLKALRLYEDLEPCVDMGCVLYQMAEFQWKVGRIDMCLDYYKRAAEIFNRMSEYTYESKAYTSIGLQLIFRDEYDSASFYFDKALELLKQNPDPLVLAITYLDYGLCYHVQFKKDKELVRQGIPFYHKAIEVASDNHLYPELSLIYIDLALAYNILGSDEDVQTGLYYLNEAKSIADTLKELFYSELMVYNQLARLESRKGNYDAAIAIAKKGLEKTQVKFNNVSTEDYSDPFFIINDRYWYKQEVRITYSIIYDIYKMSGEYEKALEYYILRENAAKEVYDQENQELVAMLEADSHDEKAQNQIAALARENEIKELKISQSRMMLIGLAILLVTFLLMGYLLLRQSKLKNEHRTIILEQKLLRLQMNPHFIFNALSNIMNFIEENNNASAIDYLSRFSRLLRVTLESSREDHILLEEEIEALGNYLELQKLRYGDKFEYVIDVDENLDPEEVAIPPLLIQPFIENAIEHGVRHKETKGHIYVRFLLIDKKIHCEVEDDGVGREKAWETEFQIHKEHKSLATEIIKDRIQAINRKMKQKIGLEIIDLKSEAMEATGTKVEIDLPIYSYF